MQQSRSNMCIASAFLYTTLSSKNHVVYDPKLRHLHLKTHIVVCTKIAVVDWIKQKKAILEYYPKYRLHNKGNF